jgi:hypothetical protein
MLISGKLSPVKFLLSGSGLMVLLTDSHRLLLSFMIYLWFVAIKNFICVLPNGPALSCGVTKPQHAPNKTSP